MDKHSKIVDLKIYKQSKPSNLAFNKCEPLFLTGEMNGGVVLLKMSPNLFKDLKPYVEKCLQGTPADTAKFKEDQNNKMENILNVVGKFEKEDN